MNRAERAFVIFCFAYCLVYFICLMLGPALDSRNLAFVVLMPMCFIGMFLISPYAPSGHPCHVSWETWRQLNVVGIAHGALWLVTATLTCYMVIRRPSVKLKAVWYAAAFLLMPIACPLCYFTRLRKANVPTTWLSASEGPVSEGPVGDAAGSG